MEDPSGASPASPSLSFALSRALISASSFCTASFEEEDSVSVEETSSVATSAFETSTFRHWEVR